MMDATIHSAAAPYSSSRQTTASNDVVVGLDDDLLAIEEKILGASLNLQVIPIVGIGGIGKTTLVRNIYHNQLIRESFDIRGWVTVSKSYRFKEILTTLQQSLNPIQESHEYAEKLLEQTLNPIQESHEYPEKLFELNPDLKEDMVYKNIKGKKYIIVIDDVWNTEVWDHLRRLLPDDENGSRIILTTRLVDVATYTKGCSPHEMQLMNEDQSWNLLRQKVFTEGVCNCELENIGMAIARSCGGLPLAIMVIAGLLSMVDETRASWEEVAEKVNVAAKDRQFEKFLSLSYTELPRHLRQCFVYMGGFPEDRDIHVGELIKLWIAEGFIGAPTSSKSLEEEAEEYLQDLIKRSLVMVGMRKPHGEIKSCILHDMMRDLSIRKADEETFCLHDEHGHGTLLEKLKAGTLEDVEYLRVMDVGKDVLDPSSAGLELYMWIPEQIFRLSNLRYLVLAYFVEIPTVISNLENLQTLIIYAMEGLVRLPLELWNMPRLRHLISSFDQLPCPEGEATSLRLENLQTLSKVCNLECTHRLVEMIPNIKKLGLLYSASYECQQGYHVDDLFSLHQLESLVNYHLENLEHLQQLEKLKVQVYAGFHGIFNPIFPSSLKKLSLSGWRLPSWNHMTIVGSLPNLQVLKLRDFRGQDSVWETREGEFPRLSFLLIERSDLLKWITGPEHFPSLKKLLLHYCYCLDEIPAGIGDIPTLELIEVKEGNKFLAESAKRIEKNLKDDGNSSFRVHRSTDYAAARSYSSSRLETSSSNVAVGLEDDLLAIKEQLCGDLTKLQVIPIVGMGGIGKTTLARNAYHDPLIRESFGIGGWVTVSQSYSLEEIFSVLLESLKPFDTKQLERSHEFRPDGIEHESDEYAAQGSEEGTKVFKQRPDSTGDRVYKTLKGRKYLVVIDDIWNIQVWHQLKRLLPNDNNRSRIILTTRLMDVATYAENRRPHEMQLMHEDQSWDLLRQKVFIKGAYNHELEAIGMKIARSCGGLPLAIVVIAGLLSTVDRTLASWEEISEKVSSTVAAKDGQFEKILTLSYTDLPRHLRQCFVYMGGFPEDREIPIAKLIKLWIAEGFIESTNASTTTSLENEAEECLQDLIKRSLVLIGTRKPHGEIKSCSLHDLMRELCIRKANEDKFTLHDVDVDGTLVERLKEGCLEDVRVMDVEKYVLDQSFGPELYTWIPEQIFRLSNLRYLVVAYLVEIPTSVSYLENVQTLIIHAMEGLVHLPPEIWTMPRLRHLVSSFDQLPCPEGEATSLRLENLQTLSKVCNLECTDTLVEMIPNIKKLGLLYSASYEFDQDYHLDDFFSLHQLGHWFNPTRDYDYRLEKLECLQQLEKLKVHVFAGFEGMLNPVFPQSLRKLTLSGWNPSWKEMSHMTIVGSLPNLEVLKLRDFGLKRWETTEGEFTHLSFLLIQRSDIEEWITDVEHFPCLKQLVLHYCWCLNEIPASIGDISTLELIEVKESSTSLVASARRIEEEQKDMGNDILQIRLFDD